MNKEFILNIFDLESLSLNIKNFFLNKGQYIIIRNYNNLTDEQIIEYYENINKNIGRIIPIDLIKDTYEISGNYWVDVKYDFNSDEGQFWRSSNHQNLHTDNTFCNKEYYANLTELVCLKTSEYSGNTTIISNNKVIDLIKYVDKYSNNNLYNEILNNEIYHSVGNNYYLKRKILEYKEDIDQYIFCYNFFPASRGKNNDQNIKIINKLNNFLEEKIMLSNLMDEIKLNRGDALIFNDELVLHGRKSFLGTRHYKKTGIQLDSICLIDLNKLNKEII
jgi:alpha-ketoglutarate-dependent taurine dioxygenase